MTLLDWIVFIILLYFAFKGFQNGLVKEVLSIIGIILAIFLSIRYMNAGAGLINSFFPNNIHYVPYIAAFIIFFGTLIIVHLIIYILNKLLKIVALNLPNRFLGLLFSTLKAGLLLSLILILLSGFNIPNQKARKQSVTYPYIITLAPATFNVIAYLDPGAKNYTKTIKQTLKNYNPINNFPQINKK